MVEFALGATATYDDNSSVTVVEYLQPYSDSISILKPPAGVEYAVATVRICAGGTATKSLDLGSWEALGSTGESSRQSIRATPIGAGLIMFPLEPGECTEGDVGFEVPAGQPQLFVVWNDPEWESAKWRVG